MFPTILPQALPIAALQQAAGLRVDLQATLDAGEDLPRHSGRDEVLQDQRMEFREVAAAGSHGAPSCLGQR